MRMYPKNPNSMGAAVREARRRAGLTQKQFARAIGVAKASVSRWERGACVPEEEARQCLTQQWGCPPEAFECWNAAEIAAEIEGARIALGMTRREFARAADVSERMYRYYAAGDQTPTTPALARMIGAVLRASANRAQAAALARNLVAVYRSGGGDLSAPAALAA